MHTVCVYATVQLFSKKKKNYLKTNTSSFLGGDREKGLGFAVSLKHILRADNAWQDKSAGYFWSKTWTCALNRSALAKWREVWQPKAFLSIESEAKYGLPYVTIWSNLDRHEHATPMESSLGSSTNCGRPVGPSRWCRWQILSLQPYPALTDALLTFQWLIMDSLLWRNGSHGDDSFHRQNFLHSCITLSLNKTLAFIFILCAYRWKRTAVLFNKNF